MIVDVFTNISFYAGGTEVAYGAVPQIAQFEDKVEALLIVFFGQAYRAVHVAFPFKKREFIISPADYLFTKYLGPYRHET